MILFIRYVCGLSFGFSMFFCELFGGMKTVRDNEDDQQGIALESVHQI